MPLLSNLKIAKTISVKQTLVNLIAEQAELDDEFLPSPDNVAGFLQCVRLALPYFSAYIGSTPFANYICLLVITKLKEIEELEGGAELSLDIIKLLAELSPFLSEDEQNKECAEIIHKVLLEYIPLPLPADVENGCQSDEPDLKFTHIECLLFVFSHFLKHCPEFLTAADNAQRFRDLKARLQFLARGVQSGIKTFRESLVSNKSKETKAEETKMKAIALRTMNNINTLIKDLFRTPPTFKTSVTLSWKPVTTANVAVKRESEGMISEEKKMKRDYKSGRELYQPPGGKYSTNIHFPPSRGSNFYSRGRGGKRFY
ncbi:apoptosis inhibitor 5 [Caerostris extrusa]|uniref:Apoptosis inhibitor 5 n=1 Tax=Caerostris extrusa TaxID=172846 RepID=A0AAV4Y2P7_CAEEX|nr:apoptosis inhibitor 5 [Caerostris extrusa]